MRQELGAELRKVRGKRGARAERLIAAECVRHQEAFPSTIEVLAAEERTLPPSHSGRSAPE